MTSKTNEQIAQDQQTLIDHLRELRFRLIRSIYVLIGVTIACYAFSEKIFDYVRMPIIKYLPNGGLIYTGPLDKFVAHLKLSFVCGLILSCPYWIYQIWKFIAPALYKNEKRYTIGFLFAGTFLFLVGVSFAYFIVLPAGLEFLLTFGGTVDKPMISIDHYLSFFAQICIMFGFSFELPLIIIILGLVGLVSQKFLRENRRYAIMTLAVISAIVTPPDLLSMLLLLGPMIFLYEISILFVGFFEKKREEQL